ncbi:MAG: undecaprenyl-diphosphate phosphatase [Ruminococcaceae bacterium]|nr:undecaprenyl-diphosphate phosphatase [Oscillospiraceae bacterium]
MWIEAVKAFFIGIIQGITEWLPVSSTGHMILFDQLFPMQVSDAFMSMFRVVIQLGSIMAVLTIYFDRLNPFSGRKDEAEKKRTLSLLGKVLIAAVPAAIVGLLFDDLLDKYLYTYIVVACTLILYGIAFIIIEHKRKNYVYPVKTAENISVKQALAIGCFQMLSLIPGTSRSGSTIIGALCVGVSRTAAAEFSFFLAIPVMLGASGLKLIKYLFSEGFAFGATEWMVLILGTAVAFLVSVAVIRFLTDFVRRHSFAVFGYYRIVLGILVLLYALIRG